VLATDRGARGRPEEMSLTTRAPRTPSQIGDSKTWSSCWLGGSKFWYSANQIGTGHAGHVGIRDNFQPWDTSMNGHLSRLKASQANDFKRKLRRDGTGLRRAGRDSNAARELGGLEIVDVYLGRFDHASVGRQNRRFEFDPEDLFIRRIDADLQLRGYDANGPPQFRVKATWRNPDPVSDGKSAKPLAHMFFSSHYRDGTRTRPWDEL